MADSEVRQKEWTILETERLIRKIEQCEGMPAKLILMRHFFEAGMRAGEIAMREKAGNRAAEFYLAKGDALDIARAIRELPAAPEEKKP